jgi:type I restriction enzyme S subunit
VGSLYWVDDDFFPIDTVFYVVSKSAVPLTWLYQSLLLMDIKSLGADSAVPGVNRNAVYTIPLVIAPPALQEHFLLNAYPTISRLQETNRQTKSLSSLRDALLPKLLSGQIRIPDAEKLIAGAV